MENIKECINKLFKNPNKNYIFVYTPPKVGSTTLVTSLRVSLGKSYNIIHIHDEIMLNVLTGIKNVKVNDIIDYVGKTSNNIFVIDVYRTPIERKMSEFFEKIGTLHFNNSDKNVSSYPIKRIINRFNKVFPHIENNDHFCDKYNIGEQDVEFDFEKKYLIKERNNIKYIKLRLCDSEMWGNILSEILKTDIVIVNDYETDKKEIGEMYKKFKEEYKLPLNYFEEIKKNKYLNLYYTKEEIKKYLAFWYARLDDNCAAYTVEEYKFYENLCLENQYQNEVQIDHYIDNGCFCKNCSEKRRKIYFNIKNGKKIEKIVHYEN